MVYKRQVIAVKLKKKKKLVWDRIGMPVRFFRKLRVGFCALKHIKS